MKDYYLGAAMGCKMYKDPKACQSLANLCVLVLYSDNSAICQLFTELTTASGTTLANTFYYDTGYKTGLPWLYYDRDYSEII